MYHNSVTEFLCKAEEIYEQEKILGKILILLVRESISILLKIVVWKICKCVLMMVCRVSI